MIPNILIYSNKNLGSSFVSPALGGVGQRRLNTKDKFPPKKIGRSPKADGQKEKGVWGK